MELVLMEGAGHHPDALAGQLEVAVQPSAGLPEQIGEPVRGHADVTACPCRLTSAAHDSERSWGVPPELG
ncbi:hypothetical protein [Nonomuraea sp. NPDC048916]|uniref:hypothetical protein n=1 Tax=Nonomuraea sp. NPDC048916 TaxID=3154232 RepID=UPI0033D4C554